MEQVLKKLRIRQLGKDKSGQIALFVALFLLPLVLFLFTVPNVTYVTAAKMRAQTAADIGAYTASLWLARGLNLITICNIGIRDMLLMVMAITLILAIAWVLTLIPVVSSIGFAICLIFFNTSDPASAALGNYPEDVQNLYDSANWLSKREKEIAKAFPVIADAMGSYLAYENMGVDSPRPDRGGVALKMPIGKIELKEDESKTLLKVLQGYAEFIRGNDYGLGGSVGGDLKVGGDGRMQMQFTWSNAADSCRAKQEYYQRVVVLKFTYKNDQGKRYQGSLNRSPWLYRPRDDALYQEYRSFHQLPLSHPIIEAMGYHLQRNVLPAEVFVKEVVYSPGTAYWPKDKWQPCYPESERKKIHPYIGAPPPKVLRKHLLSDYYVRGYEILFKVSKDGGLADTKEHKTPKLYRVDPDYKPYALGFTWHKADGSGFGFEPAFFRSIFGVGLPFPLTAIAQSEPYLDVKNPSLKDSLFEPKWDARLVPLELTAEKKFRSLSAKYREHKGDIDFEKLIGEILLH